MKATWWSIGLGAAVALAGGILAACDVSVGNGDFSVGLTSGKATDQWTRTYQLLAGGRLEILNVNGRIDVEATDGQTVEVTADRTAKARTDDGARELLRGIEMREDVSAASVRIETKALASSLGSSQEVDYRVRVPRSTSLYVRTQNGSVNIDGVEGAVVASSTNGGVLGKGLAGGVEASTTNGAIRLALDAVAAPGVKAETVNGSITIDVPPQAKADIAARCVNGSVSVTDLTIERSGEASRRRVEGRVNGGGPRIEAATTNGSIRITGRS